MARRSGGQVARWSGGQESGVRWSREDMAKPGAASLAADGQGLRDQVGRWPLENSGNNTLSHGRRDTDT